MYFQIIRFSTRLLAVGVSISSTGEIREGVSNGTNRSAEHVRIDTLTGFYLNFIKDIRAIVLIPNFSGLLGVER